MNSFASGDVNPICFIIKNVSPSKKQVKIFNYPTGYGQERNLMDIPGVSEDDIRTSLLKGELNTKIKAGDVIVTCSQIDLLQFNSDQQAFLQSAGITSGFQISSSNLDVIRQEDIVLLGNTDGYNTLFTLPTDLFYIQNTQYKIIVYLNGIKQHINDDYLPIETGGTGTGFDAVMFFVSPRNGDIITADYYITNS